MAKGKSKPEPVGIAMRDLISEGFSELECLGEELREWADGIPENLQGGSKHEEVEEAASYLEELDAPIEPDCPLAEYVVTFTPPKPKRRSSRGDRRDEACGRLELAADELRTIADAATELADELDNARETADAVYFPGMM